MEGNPRDSRSSLCSGGASSSVSRGLTQQHKNNQKKPRGEQCGSSGKIRKEKGDIIASRSGHTPQT